MKIATAAAIVVGLLLVCWALRESFATACERNCDECLTRCGIIFGGDGASGKGNDRQGLASCKRLCDAKRCTCKDVLTPPSF